MHHTGFGDPSRAERCWYDGIGILLSPATGQPGHVLPPPRIEAFLVISIFTLHPRLLREQAGGCC